MGALMHNAQQIAATVVKIAAQPRRHLLVMAYGCEPGKGSEQGVGWNWSLQLARFANVTVITRSNNQASIEKNIPSALADRIQFMYYDAPAWIRRFKNKEKGLYGYYLLWQWGAYRLARQLHSYNSFDCAIQLSFGSIWLPVFIHRLRTRFVWGPIGGGEAIPDHLAGKLKGRAWLLQSLRNILKKTTGINLPLLSVLGRADLILVRTRDTEALVPKRYRNKVVTLLETGVSPDLLQTLERQPSRALRENSVALFTGRLVGFKNVEMLLHALNQARRRGAKIHLRIVGDGPESKPLRLLARALGLEADVTFTGAVAHEAVMQELRNADIYAFPSLREAGVWSLIEAMCAGLPVLCIDTSGMSVITDNKSAIRINPTSRDVIIRGLADGLVDLAASSSLRETLGSHGRARMQRELLWDRKGEFLWRVLSERVGV